MPLRVRLALVFAAGAALLIGAGGFLFVNLLAAGLHGSVVSALQSRAAALAQTLPDRSKADQDISRLDIDGDTIYQVLTPVGSVTLSSSRDLGSSLLSPRQLSRAMHRNIYLQRTVGTAERAPYLLLAEPLTGSSPDGVLVVGESLALLDQSVHRVELALSVGGPLAIAVAGLGAWLLAGAALAPVERMRRQAAEISDRDREASLLVPTTRDEVAALALTLNQLLERLQNAISRQRGFVAAASHELRTPLAILRAELELANREGRTKEELIEAVASAAEETERLVRMAEDLLLLARSDESAPLVQLSPGDLVAVAKRSVEAFSDRARIRGVSIVLDGPDHLGLTLDEARIRQVVDNLIDNALRFAPAGSEVEVRVREEAGGGVIEVADRGPGFPAEFLPHAFERFRRPDQGRSRDHGGAGLGLSIVKALVDAHHGLAEVANRPGGGAVVKVFLPSGGAPPAPLLSSRGPGGGRGRRWGRGPAGPAAKVRSAGWASHRLHMGQESSLSVDGAVARSEAPRAPGNGPRPGAAQPGADEPGGDGLGDRHHPGHPESRVPSQERTSRA
jgi:two-component system OmpR family sensor kinase